ncbi:protein of unknown function [Clostridium beijerinckii]|nr:protein of unknown function [Clostridium beijerinckii]
MEIGILKNIIIEIKRNKRFNMPLMIYFMRLEKRVFTYVVYYVKIVFVDNLMVI